MDSIFEDMDLNDIKQVDYKDICAGLDKLNPDGKQSFLMMYFDGEKFHVDNSTDGTYTSLYSRDLTFFEKLRYKIFGRLPTIVLSTYGGLTTFGKRKLWIK
ncbi:MAG: hypothetical protein WA061_02590 [Microgenomates group bacterium]